MITSVIKLDWSSEENISTVISSHQHPVDVVIATGEIPCVCCMPNFLKFSELEAKADVAHVAVGLA